MACQSKSHHCIESFSNCSKRFGFQGLTTLVDGQLALRDSSAATQYKRHGFHPTVCSRKKNNKKTKTSKQSVPERKPLQTWWKRQHCEIVNNYTCRRVKGHNNWCEQTFEYSSGKKCRDSLEGKLVKVGRAVLFPLEVGGTFFP